MLRTYDRTGLPVRSVVKCSEHTIEQVDLQDKRLKCSQHTTEQVDQ